MDGLIGRAGRLGALLYLLTFALATGESALFLDLVVPGESGMVLVGAAGRRGDASLPLLIVAATAGAIVGDSFGFFVGRRWGTRLAERWELTRRHVAPKLVAAERHVERLGGRSIFVARWVGALRAVLPPVAGASTMPYRTFLAWSSAAALLWTTAMVSAGWLLGGTVAAVIDRLGWGLSLVALVVIAGMWWRRRRRGERSADPDPHTEGQGGGRSTRATSEAGATAQ